MHELRGDNARMEYLRRKRIQTASLRGMGSEVRAGSWLPLLHQRAEL